MCNQVLALHMPGRVFGGFGAVEDARHLGKRLSMLPAAWCCLAGRDPQPYTLLQVGPQTQHKDPQSC